MLFLKGKVRKIRTIQPGTRKDGTKYGMYHILSVETINVDQSGEEDPEIHKFSIDDPSPYAEGKFYLFIVRAFRDRLFIQSLATADDLSEVLP